MKKGFLILTCISVFNVFSQKKTTEKAKDTLKTEVVEVVTTYNPKIADANKITINPSINLLEKTKKQPLKYTIFSIPVASTFIPKSGVIKGIDVGVREKIYGNFVAVGFGNYTSPYFETFLHKKTDFQSEFGLSAKHNASYENIENTVLNSDFSNSEMSLFYKQDARYFDWKVSVNSERNHYNWYGIDQNYISNSITRFINERQEYNFFNAIGEMDFLDAYVDKSSLSFSYFNDDFNSKEILIGLNTDLDIPTSFLRDNLKIGTRVEYLNGSFGSNYAITNVLNYNFFTVRIAPEYNITYKDFAIKLGAKIFTSFDGENSITNFLAYPDMKIQKALLKEYLQFFGGISGDLKTN
jgi:hypothetical protein